MSKILRFVLYNHFNAHEQCLVQMDEEVFARSTEDDCPDELRIFDPISGTCRNSANGAGYMLVPIRSHVISSLERLKHRYHQIVAEPTISPIKAMQKQESLCEAVGRLFEGEVTYHVVRNQADMNALINPRHGEDNVEKVKSNIFEDLLTYAAAGMESMGIQSSDEMPDQEVQPGDADAVLNAADD